VSAEKHELCSPGWIAAVRRFIEERAAGSDLRGIEVSFSEIFDDPPPHLDPERRGRIGWYFRVADGRVEVRGGVLENACVRIIGDYAAVLPLARIVHGDGPAERARAAREAERAIARGTLRLEGDRSRLAALPWAGLLHDHMARRTA
jgi:hypothetical protein